MSIIYQSQDEIRFLKRKNLEEESRLIGNNLRDQIRSYGIDCIYHKLNLDEFNDFRKIRDENTLLKKAYGYNTTPTYDVSAEMITYCEFSTDIFQLNKYGLNPNVEVDFNFDKIDFACALATKVGQLKEYKINEKEIICEIPECENTSVEYNGKKYYLSSDVFPYELGYQYRLQYTTENLSGYFRTMIHGYDINEDTNESEETTILCDPYEHTDFNIVFPANKDLYKSMKYIIESDSYLETLIYLTYKIHKVKTLKGFKYILKGKIHGSVLFYDINQLGKYLELIHPMVGDIIEIDFPEENNREKYEITDCFDKSLTNDGINPLLHKYIWKCKAKRYINSYEIDSFKTEADERLEEKHKFDQIVQEEIAKDISMYDDLGGNNVKEDAVYGGQSGTITEYDHNIATMDNSKFDYLDEGTMKDIFIFQCGAKMCTDGVNFIFVDAFGNQSEIATNSIKTDNIENDVVIESNARWLKATDSRVVFVNIQNESNEIVCDFEANADEIEICLNDLHMKTIDSYDINKSSEDNFYKFKGTKTYMYATQDHLFIKLDSNKMLYKVI